MHDILVDKVALQIGCVFSISQVFFPNSDLLHGMA